MSAVQDRIVGADNFRYRALASWEQLPPGWSFGEVAGVAIDSQDRVFVFNRGSHPVIIFDSDGKFQSSWGEGIVERAHGVTIAPDDTVWLTDDAGHTVRRFTPDGRLLLTLGAQGRPSDTGVRGMDYRTITRGGSPFNYPTNVALGADGSLFITDGYGNARVHHFSADGQLLHSWGEPGTGPGQFQIPHGLAIDRAGNVYVADRENSRIQIFSPAGRYIAEWGDVARPMQICIDNNDIAFVVEVGWTAGVWPWQKSPAKASKTARLSIFDSNGDLLCRWGEGEEPCAVGAFFAPHDICIDSHGDLYVAEVVLSAGGNRGLVSPQCHSLQKFVRL